MRSGFVGRLEPGLAVRDLAGRLRFALAREAAPRLDDADFFGAPRLPLGLRDVRLAFFAGFFAMIGPLALRSAAIARIAAAASVRSG